MTEKIDKITFGIRFDRAFKIPDIAGGIIDDIIRKAPFEKGRFDTIRHTNSGKVFFNESTKELIAIDTDNLMLALNVKNFAEDFSFIREKVLAFFMSTIFEKNKIQSFNRIGIIFRHHFKGVHTLDKSVADFTEKNIDSQNEYSLRFSKKLPAMQGRTSQGNNDYRNVICTIERDEEFEDQPSTKVEVDYQYYYNPPIDNIRDIKAADFLDNSLAYLKSNFHDNWMKNLEKDSSSGNV